MQCITYSSVNAPKDKAWIAYVVLPDGTTWQVRFEGETEQQVIGRATAFYEQEKAKQERLHGSSDAAKPIQIDKTVSGRGQHFVGTAWMIHHGKKEKIRCAATEVAKFEAQGYVRGGPRTQV